MAHMVEKMAFIGATPWHNTNCQRMPENATVEQWIQASGLNTTAQKRQLFYYEDDGTPTEVRAVCIRRVEDKAILCDHIGPDFELWQNIDKFKSLNRWIENGEASIETAGSLAGGRRVWVLLKLNRQPAEITAGDNVCKYLLAADSFDGSLAIRHAFTPIRTVCQNTLDAGLNHELTKCIRIFHTANLHANVEKLHDTINMLDASFEGTAEQYRHLARRGINTADLRKYFKIVIGKKDDEELSTRAENIIEKMVNHYHAGQDAMREVLAGYEVQKQATAAAESSLLDSMIGNFESGRGTDAAPQSTGTYWQAYNAVTEYLTHDRGKDSDKRLNSLWFGDSAKMNSRALQTALTMAG